MINKIENPAPQNGGYSSMDTLFQVTSITKDFGKIAGEAAAKVAARKTWSNESVERWREFSRYRHLVVFSSETMDPKTLQGVVSGLCAMISESGTPILKPNKFCMVVRSSSVTFVIKAHLDPAISMQVVYLEDYLV